MHQPQSSLVVDALSVRTAMGQQGPHCMQARGLDGLPLQMKNSGDSAHVEVVLCPRGKALFRRLLIPP